MMVSMELGCPMTSSGCGPTSRPVGRSASSGGYFRQPFESAERELRAWFVEQCAARGLRVEADEFGNVVGVVAAARTSGGPGVLTGSHLDSVLDGGAYDGPLGVVSALAAIDVLRERGFVPARPIGVGVFVEEEGSRFGLACLGSRLATGAVVVGAGAGAARPGRRARSGDVAEGGGPGLLADVGTFVELHVEQGRDLVDRGAAVGVASEIWPHGRYRFDFDRRGQPRGHDPDGGPARPDADLRDDRAGRQQAGPAGRAAGDVRPGRGRAQRHQRGAVAGDRLARRAGVVRRRRWPSWSRRCRGRPASGPSGTAPRSRSRPSRCPARSPSTPTLAARIAADHEGGDWPVIPTAAGHDAGHPVRGRHPHRDAVRPQPDRRQPLARPSTPRCRTAWPASTPWPTPSSGWRGD